MGKGGGEKFKMKKSRENLPPLVPVHLALMIAKSSTFYGTLF